MTGILLMAFGGPETREAIGPFMANLMGREPSPEVLARAEAKYDLIGGFSPLPTITGRQAAALQGVLREMGYNLPVAVGMKYWRPFIGQAISGLVDEGVDRVIAVSMSPHYSRVSIGAYEEELEKAGEAYPAIEIELLPAWYDNPGFLAAIAEKIEKALPEFGGAKPFIVFSTHSLPVAHIETGDPYVCQVEETVRGIMRIVGDFEYRLAYQSKGQSPGPWLRPEVEEVLEELAAARVRDVLLVPVGFASDHLETFYDIDVVHRRKAESLGLNFKRTESLNDSPAFIRALAEAIADRLR